LRNVKTRRVAGNKKKSSLRQRDNAYKFATFDDPELIRGEEQINQNQAHVNAKLRLKLASFLATINDITKYVTPSAHSVLHCRPLPRWTASTTVIAADLQRL
jgi:hypothetical protein